MPDGRLQGALQAKRGPGRPRSLRTAANAEIICDMVESGYGIPEIAAKMGWAHSAILKWIREDDAKNEGAAIGAAYARAREARWEIMADEILALADDRSFAGQPDANALVQQQRLAVDTRKWLLSKVLPKRFGDRIEISGDPDAPVVSRIELVAVHPPLARVIDNEPALPSHSSDEPQKR